MTACTRKEEDEWRARLSHATSLHMYSATNPSAYTWQSLNMKSLGTVFGKPGEIDPLPNAGRLMIDGSWPGTVARRLSIHRATTVGPKSPLCQVILKNTSATKSSSSDSTSPGGSSAINRSQSLLTTNSRVPVLAPPRSERARVEALLADVWSRRTLPFPGMTHRSKSEHLVRSSASTMMRKLSVATITSSFSRRSPSLGAVAKSEDEELPHVSGFIDGLVTMNCESACPDTVGGETRGGEQTEQLPMIRDVTEFSSSTGNSAGRGSPEGELEGHLGTVRRLDLAKLDSRWDLEEEEAPVGTPALRTSSSNSLNRHTPCSPRTVSTCSLAKENVQQRRNPKYRNPRSASDGHKLSSRWSKVSGINRGFMSQGIRNLFR